MDARVLSDLKGVKGRVCVLGSMNADYTVVADHLPAAGETVPGGALRLLPGGKSGNQAAAAARLGADVRMFGAVGNDANAAFLLERLTRAGVDVGAVLHDEGPSGATLITVDKRGENTIVYSAGANARVDTAYVRSSARSLVSGSVLGLCLESPKPAVMAAARLCHDAGMRVLLNDSPFESELPDELVDASDVLLVNQVEAQELFGAGFEVRWEERSCAGLVEALSAIGFDQAVVTLGAEGSVVVDAGECVRVAPVQVDAVDTTGCGDAFMGCLLAGLSTGYSLLRSARMASYVAAYAACGEGAQASYGTVTQVERMFAHV